MQIGYLAAKIGVTSRMIRYYEKGLVKPKESVSAVVYAFVRNSSCVGCTAKVFQCNCDHC